MQIQLFRIQLRVPEYGWTTQKVFHLMNFIVNGGDFIFLLASIVVFVQCLLIVYLFFAARAVVFGFHAHVFLFRSKVSWF